MEEDSKSVPDDSTQAEPLDHKNRRLERLESLQNGEEALFSETFPRLEHRTETMSVSDFIDAHKQVETPDAEIPSVTLYGMLVHSVSCPLEKTK